MDSIGKRIVHIRKKRNYTQEKLAKLEDISIQFLSDIENGKKSMTVSKLIKIANSLNVSTDHIVYGRNSDEHTETNDMLDKLSEKDRQNAEKLLEVFIDLIKYK